MRTARIILFILISFMTASPGGCSSAKGTQGDYCATLYPVVLVHGIAFRDRTLFLKYWGPIPGKLEERGAKVFMGGQEAYGAIEDNAKTLKKNILEILNKTGRAKVNIIAHSKGGLDARYMISRLGMADRVAVLTTLATPHRGSATADMIIKGLPDKKLAGALIDLYARLIGDRRPMSLKAGKELTVEHMTRFNREVPDAKGVYYQSWGAAIDGSYPNPLWKAMMELLYEKEGDNDGLVSVASCRWGVYRGLATCGGKRKVSHADIVGMHLLTGVACFDAGEFIIHLVHDLKVRGY